MNAPDEAILEAWRWDERIFPHAAVCPDHAEQDRLARAERTASLDPATAPFEAVGLRPLRTALDRLRESYTRPVEVRCHHNTCDRTLADSIDVEWTALS